MHTCTHVLLTESPEHFEALNKKQMLMVVPLPSLLKFMSEGSAQKSSSNAGCSGLAWHEGKLPVVLRLSLVFRQACLIFPSSCRTPEQQPCSCQGTEAVPDLVCSIPSPPTAPTENLKGRAIAEHPCWASLLQLCCWLWRLPQQSPGCTLSWCVIARGKLSSQQQAQGILPALEPLPGLPWRCCRSPAGVWCLFPRLISTELLCSCSSPGWQLVRAAPTTLQGTMANPGGSNFTCCQAEQLCSGIRTRGATRSSLEKCCGISSASIIYLPSKFPPSNWDYNGFVFLLLFFRCCCSVCSSQMLLVPAVHGTGFISVVNHLRSAF